MAVAAQLEQYFSRKGIAYIELPVSPAASLEAVVSASGRLAADVIRATLLVDINGAVMAVHPFRSVLDPEAVYCLTGRKLQPLTSRQADRLFGDCAPGFQPPVGEAYQLPVMVDEDVLAMSRAVMAGGAANTLVLLEEDSLREVLAGARVGRLISAGPMARGSAGVTLEDAAEQLQRLYRLPPMPALTPRLGQLAGGADVNREKLLELIELDPGLTAQIMRYARSALFNEAVAVSSVQDAVRELGWDRVAHAVAGMAAEQPFAIPRGGSLGLDQYWSHSLCCAFLCQRMASWTGTERSLAYLCGLLHNIGLLLIAHLYPAEFAELDALRDASPEATMAVLEQQVFGGGNDEELQAVSHGAMGGILLRLWQLPDAVIKAAGVHQNPQYHGDHETSVLMVQLANALLRERGIGDEFNTALAEPVAARLGLRPEQLAELREEAGRVAEDLDMLTAAFAT